MKSIARLSRLQNELQPPPPPTVFPLSGVPGVVLPLLSSLGVSGVVLLLSSLLGAPGVVFPLSGAGLSPEPEEYSTAPILGFCVLRDFPSWSFSGTFLLVPPLIKAVSLALSKKTLWSHC